MRPAGFALLCVLLAGCPAPQQDRSPLADLRKQDGSAPAADARPVVLAFWADWAPPCSSLLAEMPKLGDKVRVVAAFAGEYRPGVEGRVGGLEFALAGDSLVRSLGIRVLPTVLVLDRSGASAARFEGYGPAVVGAVAAVVDSLAASVR